MKFLFHDGHQDIDAERNPDLGFYGVIAGAVKRFDPQVLFDPAEEQFDLPALGVERGDGRGGQLGNGWSGKQRCGGWVRRKI